MTQHVEMKSARCNNQAPKQLGQMLQLLHEHCIHVALKCEPIF